MHTFLNIFLFKNVLFTWNTFFIFAKKYFYKIIMFAKFNKTNLRFIKTKIRKPFMISSSFNSIYKNNIVFQYYYFWKVNYCAMCAVFIEQYEI